MTSAPSPDSPGALADSKPGPPATGDTGQAALKGILEY
jgi:hypothetical protein